MGRSTVHYTDSETNNILKRLHNKLRPAGTPVERVEYIIELLLLRIFEAKLKQEEIFNPLRSLFSGENYRLLFSHLLSLNGEQMVDPDFEDTIFDPACGTAGFLFDAFDYVIEKAQKTRKFPAENIANMYYRTGISGIEYQGRIRKMAAVNMYIRGLNPHNIEQGDSLKMFDPATDGNSKSVVIANPPFGAERDQPAYPNVWEEYPKESETTILFVKLMFELLKKKGRCAVVVSEGFLTWGQNSARALRKMLLNEANLKAVISLPQGVFVSKSGQGAKTSILYFEKGEPTDFVWYYKIENDGFSMGTNRKSINGSQIPEMIELFAQVKACKKPKDTKYSFCVTKEQIETLDPRITQRIAKEVSEIITEKNKKKRQKLVENLDKKLAEKKISQVMYDEKLWQFDNLVESQVENEITKAIEKAHQYHFNMQNYRSNLSDEQKKDWQKVLQDVEIKNRTKLEKRYKELQKAEPKTTLKILASFNSDDALQMDIAREYLSKLDEKILKESKNLGKLEEILKETTKFPFVSLSSLLIQKAHKIKLKDEVLYKQVKIKLYGKGILLRQEVSGSEIKTASQFIINQGDFIMSKIDARNGAFGIVPDFLDGAVVTSSFPYFEIQTEKVNPKYLEAIITQKSFYDQINDMVSGSTGRRSVEVDKFLELQIPLPPLEIQNEIVEKIEKQKQIIEGAEKIEQNYEKNVFLTDGSKVPLSNFIIEMQNGLYKSLENYGQGICIVRINDYKTTDTIQELKKFKRLNLSKDEILKYFCSKDDILVNRVNSLEHVGKVCIIGKLDETLVYESNMIRVRFDNNKLLPRYALYVISSFDVKKQLQDKSKRAINQVSINQEDLKSVEFVIPSLETQRQIVEKLDKQMEALEGVRLLKSEAQKRIEEILAEVWGE